MKGNEKRGGKALGVKLVVLKTFGEHVGQSVGASRNTRVIDHEQRLNNVERWAVIAEDRLHRGPIEAELQIPDAIDIIGVTPDRLLFGNPVKESGLPSNAECWCISPQSWLANPAALFEPDGHGDAG
jgi:hypothetical protein